jgi:hypothetical protein
MSTYTILDANKVSKTAKYYQSTDIDYLGFKLSELVNNSLIHDAVIVDISSTIGGDFYYYSSSTVNDVLTKNDLPFLISDKINNTDVSCNLYFVPNENKDGQIKITYFTLGSDSVILNDMDLSYNRFSKMSQQRYLYYVRANATYNGRELSEASTILLTTATVPNTDVYNEIDGTGLFSSATGIPVLNSDLTSLNTTYSDIGYEMLIGATDPSVYDISENYVYVSQNYYRAPEVIEYDEDGNAKSYRATNYKVMYNTDTSGIVYDLNNTQITLDEFDSILVSGKTLQFQRVQLKTDPDTELPIADPFLGAIQSGIVFYSDKINKIYTPLELTITHTHSNDAPFINNGTEIFIKNGAVNYNQDTALESPGISISQIITDLSLNYVENNVLYDASGIAFIEGSGDVSGSWNYRIGSGSWVPMTFDDNTIWYFSTKKNVSGVSENIYIKFIPTSNNDGQSTLPFYAWDLTQSYVEANIPIKSTITTTDANGNTNTLALRGGENSLSDSTAYLRQPNTKINRAPTINQTVYTYIQDNTKTFVDQDNEFIISFDDFFFDTIEFTDESGPARGIVITDISSTPLGNWYYGTKEVGAVSPSTWYDLTTGLHIKEHFVNTDNVLIKFSPKKYRYGTFDIFFRGWDQYVDVSNGSIVGVDPASIGGYGTYSLDKGTIRATIRNVDDGPVLLDASNNVLLADISGLYATYQQGYIPTQEADGIPILDLLNKFKTDDIFACKIKNVDISNGDFTDYEYDKETYDTLGIVIDEIEAADLSGIAISYYNGGWQDISATLFVDNKSLHLKSTNTIRFKVPADFKGDNAIKMKFRVWNTKNATNSYELISATGSTCSVPVVMNLNYSDTNDAPIVDVVGEALTYTFDLSQNEGIMKGHEFRLGDIVDALLALQNGSNKVIRDEDDLTYTRIPKFGFAFYALGTTFGFNNPGTWKYRRTQNGAAQTIDMAGGAFHICVPSTGDDPYIYFEPATNKVYGTIQLQAYLWDRSNIVGTENGTVENYSKVALPATRGGTTAYSIKPVYLNYIINNINDRPIVSSGILRLPNIKFNAYDNSGESLYNILINGRVIVSDPDPTDIGKHGIGITGLSNIDLGTWQYSTAMSGSSYNWQNIPDNATDVLHLDPVNPGAGISPNHNIRLRFVPKPGLGALRTGIRIFSYVLWDKENAISNGQFIPIDIQNDSSYSLIVYTGRITLTT